MSEDKNIIERTLDKLNLALESKATLNAANTVLETNKLELETQVAELTDTVETLNTKVTTIETAEKERTDKLEVERKASAVTERETIYTQALEAGKFEPGQKEKIEGLGFDNTQLAAYFEAMGVKFEMEDSTPAVNPNAEVEKVGIEAESEGVQELIEGSGLDIDKVNAVLGVEKDGGDK